MTQTQTTEPQWSEWIEHDQNGCPTVLKVGMVVEIVERLPDGSEPHWVETAHAKLLTCENWLHKGERVAGCLLCPILRYRYQKPRGKVMLDEILTKLNTPTHSPTREQVPA